MMSYFLVLANKRSEASTHLNFQHPMSSTQIEMDTYLFDKCGLDDTQKQLILDFFVCASNFTPGLKERQ